jgi:hypothetical protein
MLRVLCVVAHFENTLEAWISVLAAEARFWKRRSNESICHFHAVRNAH